MSQKVLYLSRKAASRSDTALYATRPTQRMTGKIARAIPLPCSPLPPSARNLLPRLRGSLGTPPALRALSQPTPQPFLPLPFTL